MQIYNSISTHFIDIPNNLILRVENGNCYFVIIESIYAVMAGARGLPRRGDDPANFFDPDPGQNF